MRQSHSALRFHESDVMHLSLFCLGWQIPRDLGPKANVRYLLISISYIFARRL